MSYKDTDYTIMITLVCWPKWMNSGAETHLAGGVMSAFVSHRPPLLECPTLTIIGSTALRKGPQRFWLHCHDCQCTLMLMCQAHLGGEVVCAVIVCVWLSLPLLAHFKQHGHWMNTECMLKTESAQVSTKSEKDLLQECGCHLWAVIKKKKKTKGHIQ